MSRLRRAQWDNQNKPKLIDKREQVIDPLTAYQITSIMEGVIKRGTGVAIKAVGKHLTGKTGTTNEAKDLWFIGYSRNVASAYTSATIVPAQWVIMLRQRFTPRRFSAIS